MLFWLKKILTLPFLPLYFTLFTASTGLVLLARERRPRLAKTLLFAAFIVLALASNKGVAFLLIRPLENQNPPVPDAATIADLPPELRACRAIIVLGGGHGESASFSRINQLSPSALARLAEAIRLLRVLPADTRLIVSGHAGFGKISHAQVLAEAAISLGVAPERIMRLDHARDTEDEANHTLRLLGPSPCALVTSAWHMPRARVLFQSAGLTPFPCPADYLLRPDADSGWDLLLFDLGSLERSTKAMHEYLGLLWTHLRHAR